MSKYLITILFAIFSVVYVHSETYSQLCNGAIIKSDNGATYYYFPKSITKDKTGKYIYATFEDTTGIENKIQVVKSSDFGLSWSDAKLPSKKIKESLFDFPKIITNDSGQFVYLTWYNTNPKERTVQIAISSDFGETWFFPEKTPVLFSPNLSKELPRINSLEMATSESGQHTYVSWQIDKNNKNLLQIAMSHDFGKSWKYSNKCNGGISSYLFVAKNDETSLKHMTIDSTGQHISIIWGTYSKTSENYIDKENSKQIISSDFGETWECNLCFF